MQHMHLLSDFNISVMMTGKSEMQIQKNTIFFFQNLGHNSTLFLCDYQIGVSGLAG